MLVLFESAKRHGFAVLLTINHLASADIDRFFRGLVAAAGTAALNTGSCAAGYNPSLPTDVWLSMPLVAVWLQQPCRQTITGSLAVVHGIALSQIRPNVAACGHGNGCVPEVLCQPCSLLCRFSGLLVRCSAGFSHMVMHLICCLALSCASMACILHVLRACHGMACILHVLCPCHDGHLR